MFDKARGLMIGMLACSSFSSAWAQGVSNHPAGSSEEKPKPALPLTFRGDTSVVSKYVWRGQRLTNDWSFQPAATVGLGDFSINVWGTLDMTAVNEGNGLFLPQNPTGPSGNHSGLRGKFSEIDYTFSYARSLGERVSVTGGTIAYSFPERGTMLKTTSELFAGITLPTVTLAPSATLYVDVDETRETGGSGLYLRVGAGHSIALHHPLFSSIDISGSLAFANAAFGRYYYGSQQAGAHDFNLTLTVPIRFGEHWSASAYAAYSSLLGGFRPLQYPDLRDLYEGRSGPGKPETFWGGGTVGFTF